MAGPSNLVDIVLGPVLINPTGEAAVLAGSIAGEAGSVAGLAGVDSCSVVVGARGNAGVVVKIIGAAGCAESGSIDTFQAGRVTLYTVVISTISIVASQTRTHTSIANKLSPITARQTLICEGTRTGLTGGITPVEDEGN